jgi:hypothetical protein
LQMRLVSFLPELQKRNCGDGQVLPVLRGGVEAGAARSAS